MKNTIIIKSVYCARWQIIDIFLHIVGAQGEGFLADTSDSEGDDKDEGPRANFRLDDWLHFRMDSEVSAALFWNIINTSPYSYIAGLG